jgi:transcriptional regulator with XRE-family HTH domain
MTEGTKLAARIKALGYSLNEVCDGTGMDRWQINDYLNRRHRPRTKTLLRFARFLECEPETIRD